MPSAGARPRCAATVTSGVGTVGSSGGACDGTPHAGTGLPDAVGAGSSDTGSVVACDAGSFLPHAVRAGAWPSHLFHPGGGQDQPAPRRCPQGPAGQHQGHAAPRRREEQDLAAPSHRPHVRSPARSRSALKEPALRQATPEIRPQHD